MASFSPSEVALTGFGGVRKNPQAVLIWAALIAALGDGQARADREAAVVALLRQPARALPALRAARATANDDQQWWIDATIQQIEAQQRKTSP